MKGFLCLVLVLLWPFGALAQSWDVGLTDREGQRTIYGGIVGGSLLGMPLAAGDFNGDGNRDVIITPMNADAPGNPARPSSGIAFMLFGDGTIAGESDLAELLPPTVSLRAAVILGADPHDYLGTEVYAADLDGDGYEDALIGAQQGDGPGNDRNAAGEVVIVWGTAKLGGSLIDLKAAAGTNAMTVIYGADSGDRLGVWVSAGDFDGDGLSDAILGADQADGPGESRQHAGETYVIYGGSQLRQQRTIDLAATDMAVTTLYGIDAEDHSGSTLRAYDVNRDGAADILIGAGLNRLSATVEEGHAFAGGDGVNNDTPDAGEAYLVFGTVGDRPEIIDLQSPPASAVFIYGIDPGDTYGEELFAGDFNGDGYGDLVIGALSADGIDNTRQDAGELALIIGSPSLPGSRIHLAASPANVTLIHGADGAGSIAGDTARLADLDGDGKDELVVASPFSSPENRISAGAIDILFGTDQSLPPTLSLPQSPDGLLSLRMIGGGDLDILAYSMGVGDFDNDGIADLLINAMGGDGRDDRFDFSGDAYVVSGPSLGRAARSTRSN